jgi:hypothetical protein
VYCVGVAKDQLVRWDLQGNRQDGSWPAPGDWSTRKRIFGPELYDGRNAGLHAAWDADVYVYAYDESRLCVVRMA